MLVPGAPACLLRLIDDFSEVVILVEGMLWLLVCIEITSIMDQAAARTRPAGLAGWGWLENSSTWFLCFSVEWEQRTRSSPQTQGGVWKLITGRKATISSQRMNSSSSVTRSPEREPPAGGEGQKKKKYLKLSQILLRNSSISFLHFE